MNFKLINRTGKFSKFLVSNVRSVSEFKRLRKKPQQVVNEILNSARISSSCDWKTVRQNVFEHESNRKGFFSEQNIDAMILNYCLTGDNSILGFSYMEFLDKEGIVKNLATEGKYFKLLYETHKDSFTRTGTCPVTEEIISRFDEMQKRHSVLDSHTLESAIQALSLTREWTKCFDLFKEAKIGSIPSNSSYSALVSAAFVNRNEELGWELLEEMIRNGRAPRDDVFISYIFSLHQFEGKQQIVEKLEKMFSFLKEYDIKCSEKVTTFAAAFVEKIGAQGKHTTVTFKGICKNCQKQLMKFELTNEEFEELKENFFKSVIIGKDIFVKSHPEELKRFSEFINERKKFDVVLDGLNVAYTAGSKHSSNVLSGMVAAVVSHFVQHNKKVVLFGRAHMSKWPKVNWNYVVRNSTVFLTQNISQDDPFILYCALNSGKDTVIVSRDLMRGHSFLLKSYKHRILFDRWLSMRQYHLRRIDNDGKPAFQIPPAFSILPQKTENIWHLPYISDPDNEQNEKFHRTWFCLKL